MDDQQRVKNETRRLLNEKGNVVRSLGEDVRVVLVKECAQTYVRTANGCLIRGQRMVAHNVADVSFVFAVMVRRRTFFQEDPSIVFLTV